MTLEQAIEQLVNLGEKDPLTIVGKLVQQNGQQWLQSEVALRAAEFAADMARHVLGSQRRGAEIQLRAGDQATTSELRIKSFWVPGTGYKRASDLTRDDLLGRADWYDQLAAASSRRAAWLRDVAALMAQEGAATLGNLKTPLPPLPDRPEELAA